MSALSALAYDLRSFRLARDVLARGEANVFTRPWWRPFSRTPPTQKDTRMDPSTAEAISVMERQLAEKDQKIAALDAALKKAISDWNEKVASIVSAFQKAIDTFEKELGI